VGSGSTSVAGTDAFTGNTLNLYSAGLQVRGLYNFANLNFYLPTTLGNGGVMLNVTDTAQLSENADGSGRKATVNVGINGASTPLAAGDKVILINAGTLIGGPNNATSNGQGMQGVTLRYDFNIAVENTNQLVATVSGGGTPPGGGTDPCQANPNALGCGGGGTPPGGSTFPGSGSGGGAYVSQSAKALSEGHLAGTTLLNQGADMVAGQGLAETVRIGRLNRQTGSKALMTALSAGSNKYKTGSHVDLDSFSLMAGAAVSQVVNAGEANFGAFLEAGNGSYDTYNSFYNVGKVKGDGKTRYWGGGLLGRMDFAETGSGNFYVDGSLRAGKVKNDVHSGLRDFRGYYARFKTSASYASLHLGGGYRWKLNETSALDLYGQAFYTRQGSDSVRLSTGDPVKFAAVNSNRIRIGGRYEWTLESVTPYVGIAYEHEFDGKAKASAYGYRIDTPDLKGDTGIAEVGIAMKPTPNRPLTLNLGIQGYVGQQEGVTGSLRVKYEF